MYFIPMGTMYVFKKVLVTSERPLYIVQSQSSVRLIPYDKQHINL
jgi:hypothetical protein